MTSAILSDDLFLLHNTGHGHPERAARLEAVTRRLSEGALQGALLEIPAEREATDEELARVHTPAYLTHVREVTATAPAILDAGDTVVSPGSLRAALRAAGGGLDLADRVMKGEIQNGFALVRPPGHHAERTHAMGFCVFNNVAIVARYLQEQHGLKKVAIVDFDVHHGNGTQHSFYEDPTVLYVSLHQYPHFPGTGRAEETGAGAGEGTTLNVPMSAGDGVDEYRRAYDDKVLPGLRDFAPEALIISAGFDAHEADPLSSTRLDSASFAWMTTSMCEALHGTTEGRVISLLEGGYDLDALAESVEQHLQALLDL